MSELTFYRQLRMDDGARTGIELDRVSLFEQFEAGNPDDRDPALRWYVDLRCRGEGLPRNPEAARQWLLDHADLIRDGFRRFADRLVAGADPDEYPLEWSDFQGLPAAVQMTIAASAMRRVDAREMGLVLRDIAEHWSERIHALDREPAVSV